MEIQVDRGRSHIPDGVAVNGKSVAGVGPKKAPGTITDLADRDRRRRAHAFYKISEAIRQRVTDMGGAIQDNDVGVSVERKLFCHYKFIRRAEQADDPETVATEIQQHKTVGD